MADITTCGESTERPDLPAFFSSRCSFLVGRSPTGARVRLSPSFGYTLVEPRPVQLRSQDDEKGVLAGELDGVRLPRVFLNLGEELLFGDGSHLVAAVTADCLVVGQFNC